ncbi:MAG: AbrB family transcriptional regulator [Alphaproteobacteria bacterium]|nr:AbrB family transcriptional regulator [Alphaproteobacteria bacterium]
MAKNTTANTWKAKGRAHLPNFVGALAAGAAGGYLFVLLNMPLAWMMGAMCTVTLLAASGAPVKMYSKLRAVMVAILGVMLGSAFSPSLVEQLAGWAVSGAFLAVYVAVAGAVVYQFFRRVVGYDPTTSYFAATPGGLNEMIIVGSAYGGDDRIISLSHASRVLLVVMTIPFWFQIMEGYQPAGGAVPGASILDSDPYEMALLVASGIIGAFLATRFKLPAALLVGPMLASAIIHLVGWSTQQPPSEVIAIAQVVIGTAIGCRFAGTPMRLIAKVIGISAVATVLLLGITVVFGWGLSRATGLDVLDLVLAYAPGGLAEMSLVALAIGGDTAFVATHHIVRIAFVVVGAPLIYKLLIRR